MYLLLSILAICGTLLYWSSKYLQPYEKPLKEDIITQDELDEVDVEATFDEIIKEIYGRLDNE